MNKRHASTDTFVSCTGLPSVVIVAAEGHGGHTLGATIEGVENLSPAARKRIAQIMGRALAAAARAA